MATATTLKAELRSDGGKGVARKLRAAGKLPAIVYGGDADATALTLDAHDAELLFRSISVENTIVDLEVEGQKGAIPVLVRQIQTHPFRPELLHVDLYRVQAGVLIDVDIPLHLEGTPEGVRNEGGVLQQVIHELPVRVLPRAIPESIEIDVSELAVGDSIHVSDLDLDEGIEVTIDPERTIVTIAAARVAEVEVEGEEAEEGEATDAPAEAAPDGEDAGESEEG